MNFELYKKTISKCTFGYSYNRIVLDEQNKPVDFIILDINPACESSLHVMAQEVLNHNVTEIFPSILSDTFDWITCFGNVALTGQTAEATGFSRILGKWFSLTVISPAPNFFVVFSFIFSSALLTQAHLDIYDSVNIPIAITDCNGLMKTINRSFIDTFGYVKSELIGENINIINANQTTYVNMGISLTEHDSLYNTVWGKLRSCKEKTWQGTVINQQKDGTLIWVNLLATGIYTDTNMLKSVIWVYIDITDHHNAEEQNRIQIYQTITNLAELRDDETGNHMKRVGLFTKMISQKLGMSDKFCKDIELFSPLHDIGKIGIRDAILRAPRKLTNEEYSIMKTHTLLGHNLVKGKNEFEMIAQITLHHHEHFDGSGYPYGISGYDIPLPAQITTLADVYDALRSKRPYKDSWSHSQTMKYIIEKSGIDFNPEIVDAFVSINNEIKLKYQELSR